jgi:lambda family phage portal protein
MSLRSRLAQWLLGGTPAPAAPVRRGAVRMVRSYAGAAQNNLTASFKGDHVAINLDLERSLRILRGRSRQLAKDNDYVKKFLRMVQTHVVGPAGFALSVPCLRPDGTIDEFDKAVCEQAFGRWARRGECDVTGRLSFALLCRLLALSWARDGEFFVRRVHGRGFGAFGYQLQVIDAALVDDSYRADLPNGHRIRMGIEVDTWGKPVAYYLLSSVESAWAARRERVPASDIWHHFIQEEPDQVRGVPWIHSAMRRLNDLGGYEEAAIIAARVGASNMGFYIPPPDEPDTLAAAQALADDTDAADNLVRDATPGTFEKLPAGYDFKQFDPDYPHANFDVFVKAMLRGVASGIGADYSTLANDLENVNYSSIRAGLLETREEWMTLQSAMVDAFLAPLWTEWLGYAFVSAQLGTLPVSKFGKYDVARWQGRRWAWVDPAKDAEAKVTELRNGLTSYSAVLRELGRDPEATWRELEKDIARLTKILGPLNAAAGSPPTKDAANAP